MIVTQTARRQTSLKPSAGPLLLRSVSAAAIATAALTDDFDDNSRDTVKWAIGQLKSAFWTFAGYSILEQNQRLEVTPVAATPASAGGYVSQSTYDMTGKAIFAKVTPSGALPGAQEVYVSFGPDDADVYLALISGGGIYIQENNSGSITTTNVVATYNATTHAWLMLAHDGGSPGNIVLYTAPSSASNPPSASDWVTQGSVPRVVTITAAKLALGCDTYASVATPVAVYFDGFNTATAAATTSYSLTAVAGAFTMTGNAGGLAYGYKLTASTGTFALTGNATGLRRGYPLVATTATFNLTGNATRLALARRLVAVAGSFALTGSAARLAVGYRLGAAAGAFTLTGNAARLAIGRRLSAATGSFALTGFATGLRVGWRLTANTGTFAMSGQAASLSYSRALIAVAGSFTLTGNSARLAISRYLRTASGSFAFTGNAANLTATGSYRLAASSGAFVLTGNAAAFRYAYRLQALTGAFSMAGMDALLSYHANVLAFVRATPPGLAAITGAGTPATASFVPRVAPSLAAIAATSSPSAPGGFVRATPPPLAELN